MGLDLPAILQPPDRGLRPTLGDEPDVGEGFPIVMEIACAVAGGALAHTPWTGAAYGAGDGCDGMKMGREINGAGHRYLLCPCLCGGADLCGGEDAR